MASKHATDDISSEPRRYNNEEIRIVIVGKTGAGKSVSGNTILGYQHFKFKFSSKSLTTVCAKAYGEMEGQKVAVIDTPGLFDTRTDEEKTRRDISQCISFASPGPHIFLVVIKLGRFTEEEKQTVQKIQKIFGEEADKHSMVLFTHGDQLKDEPIEEFLQESEELQELVERCNGQYHVFNNELKDRSLLVRKLLNKIRKITEKNGGSHYTTDMFQKAERMIEEEKQRILKEKEEQMNKEREEVKKKLQEEFEQKLKEENADMEKEKELMAAHEREMEEIIKKLKDDYEKKARKEAESSDRLISKLAIVVGVVALVAFAVAKMR